MAPHAETLSDEELPVIEPYKVLGIAKDATEDEVKSAYRKAALKHHPGILPFHFLSI
jgi:DnaJ family protein C protein 9